MFEAKVYTITIHSLGVILEEEHLAQVTVDKWNQENAENKGKLFFRVPAISSIIPDANVVIIYSYLDVNKIENIIAIGKPVVFLFNKYHDPRNTMQTELDAIKRYREKVQSKCTCLDYESKDDFSRALITALEKTIN